MKRTRRTKQKRKQHAVIALSNEDPSQIGQLIALNTSILSEGRIQLFPAGRFYARDGRNPKGWEMTEEVALRLIADANARQTDYMVDYEHQALHTRINGKPVIAAGWFKDLEWVEGEGLFAATAWTVNAKAMIKAKEYRFISPLFRADKEGNILNLINVALTNTPAIDGMSDVIALTSLTNETGTNTMNFLEQLRTLLGLAEGLTEVQIIGAVREMVNKTHAYSVEVEALKTALSAETEKLTALSTASQSSPNPAEYVPLSVFDSLKADFDKLRNEAQSSKVSGLIEVALNEGKLIPAMKDWATEYGNKDLVGLSAYLAKAPVIVALNSTQTGGKDPAGDGQEVALTEIELKVQELTGIKLKDDK